MKLTKKLFMSIMTLALVVVTLSASTFAWFTLGNTAKIEEFKVNVQTGTGMEISKDGNGWKNRLNLTQGLDLTDLEFTAVTSFDGQNFFDTDKGALILKNAGTENEVDDRAANIKYFETTFFVRVTKNTQGAASFNGVSLFNASGKNVDKDNAEFDVTDPDNQWVADVTLGNVTENVSDKTYGTNNISIINGNKYSFDALNAVKVSFTPEVANATAKIYAFENTLSLGSVPTIADKGAEANPRYVIESGLAYDYAEAKLFDTALAQPKTVSEWTEYITDADIAAAKEDGATDTEKQKVYVLVANDFVDAEAASQVADETHDAGILTGKTLDDNYMYAKVTIRIWLEGWDADCINAILSQNAAITFELKAN